MNHHSDVNIAFSPSLGAEKADDSSGLFPTKRFTELASILAYTTMTKRLLRPVTDFFSGESR